MKRRFKEKVSDSYKKDFIAEYIDLLDYKIDDVYYEIVTRKFREDYPDFYLERQYNEFMVDNVRFRITTDSTYEEIVKAFEKHIGSGDSREEAKLKSKFKYSCSNFRNEGNGNLIEFRSYGLAHTDALLFILNWVINDEIMPDFGEIQQWLKARDINSSSMMFKETFKELGGIEIVSQKNGKIKVRGLDSDEITRLDYLFALCNDR